MYVADSLWPSQIVSVCHIQYVCVIDYLLLSQTVFVCHKQSVYVTDCLWWSHTVCVRHRHSMCIINCLFILETVCICHRQFVSITERLGLSLTVQILDFFMLYIQQRFLHEIWVYPVSRCQAYQLSGPLPSPPVYIVYKTWTPERENKFKPWGPVIYLNGVSKLQVFYTCILIEKWPELTILTIYEYQM